MVARVVDSGPRPDRAQTGEFLYLPNEHRWAPSLSAPMDFSGADVGTQFVEAIDELTAKPETSWVREKMAAYADGLDLRIVLTCEWGTRPEEIDLAFKKSVELLGASNGKVTSTVSGRTKVEITTYFEAG